MKAAFISNYFNHHQKPFCDAMYKRLGDGFRFIATTEFPEWRKKHGYTEMTEDYVVKYDMSLNTFIEGCDFVIIGSAPYDLVKRRLIESKLTFFYSERIYKKGIPWIKLPKHCISNYLHFGRYKNVYMLSASAYTAFDYSLTNSFRGKCYKWGYFPEVKKYESLNALMEKKRNEASRGVSILWVGRLIGWKHPESALYVANSLKNAGYNFELNIIGTGELENQIKNQIDAYSLEDCVHMLGSMPSEEVRAYMERSDIFMFTSDRNEGWGAVLNESMNAACAVVASDAIGSVPFLLKNEENGLVFHSGDWHQLLDCVKRLIDNESFRDICSRNAYQTIITLWNAEIAADNLIRLVQSINNGKPNTIINGPCSPAPIIKGY